MTEIHVKTQRWSRSLVRIATTCQTVIRLTVVAKTQPTRLPLSRHYIMQADVVAWALTPFRPNVCIQVWSRARHFFFSLFFSLDVSNRTVFSFTSLISFSRVRPLFLSYNELETRTFLSYQTIKESTCAHVCVYVCMCVYLYAIERIYSQSVYRRLSSWAYQHGC